MSNIFDALQRAETESSSTQGSTLSLATDLLEAAEQKFRHFATPEPAAISKVESSDSPPSSPLEGLDLCPVLPVSIHEESRLVSLGKEGSLGAEKFRFLAVRLRQLRQSRPLKKVLITSTIPEEGKSTVAANLACTLARRVASKDIALGRGSATTQYRSAVRTRKAPRSLRMAQRRNSYDSHLPSGKSWGLDVARG